MADQPAVNLYDFIIRAIAQRPWLGNTELHTHAVAWAKRSGHTHPKSIKHVAIKARHALGIIWMTRNTTGIHRRVKLYPRQYKAMCLSLGLAPNTTFNAVNERGLRITFKSEPVPTDRATRRRKRQAAATKDYAGPANFAYRGYAVSWEKRTALTNEGWYFRVRIKGNQNNVFCGRALDVDSMKRKIDAHHMLDAESKAVPVKIMHEPVPVPVPAPTPEPAPVPTLAPAPANGQDSDLDALFRLAWEIMATHDLASLTITPTEATVDRVVRTVETKSYAR